MCCSIYEPVLLNEKKNITLCFIQSAVILMYTFIYQVFGIKSHKTFFHFFFNENIQQQHISWKNRDFLLTLHHGNCKIKLHNFNFISINFHWHHRPAVFQCLLWVQIFDIHIVELFSQVGILICKIFLISDSFRLQLETSNLYSGLFNS